MARRSRSIYSILCAILCAKSCWVRAEAKRKRRKPNAGVQLSYYGGGPERHLRRSTQRSGLGRAFDALYSFGDSYIDSGNLYSLTRLPPSPPYNRRNSNGPTAVEYLAQDLGIPFTYSRSPDRAGKSLNYAIAGAETGTFNNVLGSGFGQQNQVQTFLTDVGSGAVTFRPASTLFILEAGR